MRTVEEQLLLNEIEKLEKKETELLEVDENNKAEKAREKRRIWESIYFLIEDGYEYREHKEKISKIKE